MTKEEGNVYQDWLKFQFSNEYNELCLKYVNIKRSEISEVIQPLNIFDDCKPYEKWSKIILNNGNEYVVNMSYNKVMELV